MTSRLSRHSSRTPTRTRLPRLRPSIAPLVLPIAFVAGCLDLSEPAIDFGNGVTVPTGSGLRCGAPPEGDVDSLRLHFIDVGQGDAIWIETPDDGDDGNGEREGYNILVDTGRVGFDDAPGTGRVIVTYMANHGTLGGSTIDFLVITHAHADHYGGAIEIMAAFDVINVFDPGFENESNSTYLAFLSAAEAEVAENGGTIYRPLVGTLVEAEYDETTIFGTEIETIILNSEDQLRLGDDRDEQLNNTSIALSLRYAGVDVLLMADAYTEVEAEIMAAVPDLRANILKLGHHGSTSSTGPAFIEQIYRDVPLSRRFAVIQSGRRSFGGTTLPAASTIERILEYVPAESFFTTQLGDEARDESTAAGDDHVQALITGDGDVSMCYVD